MCMHRRMVYSMTDKKQRRQTWECQWLRQLTSAVLQELVCEDVDVCTRHVVMLNGRGMPTRVTFPVQLRFFAWRLIGTTLKGFEKQSWDSGRVLTSSLSTDTSSGRPATAERESQKRSRYVRTVDFYLTTMCLWVSSPEDHSFVRKLRIPLRI